MAPPHWLDPGPAGRATGSSARVTPPANGAATAAAPAAFHGGPNTPVAAIEAFFAGSTATGRLWLALACAGLVEDEARLIDSDDAACAWVAAYLRGTGRAERAFGRMLALVAAIDAELSGPALARLQAEAHGMACSGVPWLAEQGRRTLLHKAPLLRAMAARWRDLRANELDDAALWIWRDGLRLAQQAEADAAYDIDPATAGTHV